MSGSHNIEEDFTLLKKTVQQAGEIALEHFAGSPESELKDDGSPVSEADLAVDHFLRQTLLSARGDYGWVSEESAEDPERRDKELVWVVDPIDGTRAFLKRIPEWTISASLVSGDVSVLAVVYNPVTKEFYEAVHGQGAYLNDRRMKVSELSEEDIFRVMATVKVSDTLKGVSDLSFDKAYKTSSLAYRLCQLSEGKADVVLFKSGACDWDVAAAELIVREAGGKLTTFDGAPLKFNKKSVRHNGLLGTNGILHKELLKVCEKLDL